MTTHTNHPTLPEAQRGPAEQLLDVVLGGSAHLWHNRPGLNVNGVWHAAQHASADVVRKGTPVKPASSSPRR
jgi:hypothetical protein